jgi:hypothetical protein
MAASEQGKSLTWVVVMLMVAIAGLGWAFAAAQYAHSEEGWRTEGAVEAATRNAEEGRPTDLRGRRARADFFRNAFVQIPNAPAVVSFTFKNRLWLAILIGVLEAGALAFGWWARGLESKFENEDRTRRRR